MQTIDMEGLAAGWLAGESVSVLAGRYGLGMTTIRNLASRGRLPWRESRRDEEPEAPSAEDAAASEDSLTLSPWVQARIKELDIHGRREAKPVDVMTTKVVAARKWVR